MSLTADPDGVAVIEPEPKRRTDVWDSTSTHPLSRIDATLETLDEGRSYAGRPAQRRHFSLCPKNPGFASPRAPAESCCIPKDKWPDRWRMPSPRVANTNLKVWESPNAKKARLDKQREPARARKKAAKRAARLGTPETTAQPPAKIKPSQPAPADIDDESLRRQLGPVCAVAGLDLEKVLVMFKDAANDPGPGSGQRVA